MQRQRLSHLQKLRLDRAGWFRNGASQCAAHRRRRPAGVLRVRLWFWNRSHVRVDVRARRYTFAFRERCSVFGKIRVARIYADKKRGFMFISYEWLKELTSTGLSPQELRERLTMVGLAIDAVDEHGGDAVLDVEVPSNRPDCLSHVGIAREVSVIEKGQLRLPTSEKPKTEGRSADLTSVEIADPDLCPRYAGRLVRGVKIGPSPEWLAKRLEAIGQRPINNVADITNYVLHELGQPLHAFDFEKLGGRRIVVRRAHAGEKLKTLDGVERTLTNDMLVIADAEKAVALAGIMGGEESEISNQTKDVLIESAYFAPHSVRQTARQLGMDTEASRRFERGADPDGALRAQQRCVELICELAGGVATEDAIDVYPQPLSERVVDLRPGRVTELTSLSVETNEILRILEGLGFERTDDMSFKV